jgi:hypothetical protein
MWLKAIQTEDKALRQKILTEIVSRESDTIFGQGTMLEPSTPHIGKGVALGAQATAPVYPRVYRRPTLSGRLNDHSFP